MFDTLDSANGLGSEFKIRINNYKCEY